MSDSDIGSRIREQRKAQKMTQRDLAKRTGLSGATIGRIERGEVHVKQDQFETICSALGICTTADEVRNDRLTVPEILDRLERCVSDLRKVLTR